VAISRSNTPRMMTPGLRSGKAKSKPKANPLAALAMLSALKGGAGAGGPPMGGPCPGAGMAPPPGAMAPPPPMKKGGRVSKKMSDGGSTGRAKMGSANGRSEASRWFKGGWN